MSVSKKDFTAVAKILNQALCFHADTKEADDSLLFVARELADYFAKENPNFDRKRFLDAVKDGM